MIDKLSLSVHSEEVRMTKISKLIDEIGWGFSEDNVIDSPMKLPIVSVAHGLAFEVRG